MEKTRIVVFSTMDLLAEEPFHPGQAPVFTEVFEGRRLAWYSTGRLETALALGHDVYVCSIRPAFGEQDLWWRRQVDPQKVFCALEMRQPFDIKDMEKIFMKPWQRLYRRLGLEWTSFASVSEARDALSRDPRIIDGKSFSPMAASA